MFDTMFAKIRFAIKLLLIVLINKTESTETQERVCPDNEGIFPDPHDCNSFILCANYKPAIKSCPKGLYFNPTLKVCDFPEHSGCDGANRVTTFDCQESDRLYQDPNDCHSFYMCSNSRSYRVQCPAGLIFYPTANQCDYPQNTGFYCFDSRNKFPNSTDCRMYLDCSHPIHGYACPKLCPDNLQFNRYVEQCVWPEKSWCLVDDNSDDTLSDTDIDVNDITEEPNDASDDLQPVL